MADRILSVRLHRVIKAPAERVYRAFLEPDALAKWQPPHGTTCTVHEMDACVGGKFRLALRNFATGLGQTFHGEFLELVPNERIVYVDQSDDPNLPEEMKVTVTLRQVTCGTELELLHENISPAFPPEWCALSWQECLAQLAQLVEPEIPDDA